jgi:hypothetical protein
MRLNILIIFSLVILSGCTQTQEAANVKSYFDISGFFGSEATLLQKRNPRIEKEVSQDGATEKKFLKIENWQTELGIFISSDINKPAWNKSYTVISKGSYTDYIANEPKLRTQLIRVERNPDGKPNHIFIQNQTDNFLFSSEEELNYFPDSLYSIKRTQKVLILGDNKFQITGFLKKH